MKKNLIIGIILIIMSSVLYRYNYSKKININDITNSGLKQENVEVYVNATFVAGSITNDDENGYYVMFGDGVQYIVYLSNEKAYEINRYLLDNPDESYYIEGVTKLIPTSFEENGRKFVKEWLDHSHNHNGEEVDHSHEITTEEFYQYFGYVYLDTFVDFNFLMLIVHLSWITGLVFIIVWLNTKYHFIG